MKHQCLICGQKTNNPILAALSHFYLYESGMTKYLKGNIKMFGFWRGLNATLSLICPAYNTIKNWKYRKSSLNIPFLEHLKR